ncbi:MAG: GWxTD domain-containing protein [Candidatus Marinimicrobia bacterium]|nr:GWxTD domain-containing protein [Candidatus Neomarinimicrobiota bacterium]
MKVILYFILLVLISIPSLAANFDLDYAVFRGDETTDVVEVYMMIPRVLFDFIESYGEFRSSVFVRVAFISDDSVRQMKEWSFTDRTDDPGKITDTQKIPEIVTINVPKGQYRIIAIVMDLNSKKTFREETNVLARDFSYDQLELSDIQLSSQISRTETQNKFSKYFNFDIIPNASNVYGDQNSMIYAFCEVYNLKTVPGQSETYQVRYSITDINDKIIQQNEWLAKKKPGASAVEIKGMNITELNSGLYNFRIAVKEEDNGVEIVGNKRFYVAKNDQDKMMADVMEEVNLSALSEKEIIELFNPLKYHATDKERKMFRKSNIDGKRSIIKNFWKTRDPDPTTPINEAEFEYRQRMNYVTEHFSSPQREGWKTDMGRVFLIYGQPSEIERFPSSLESKPYQIWYYYEFEGGAIFVFVDKSGFGMMELVHSTARNELQDERWERWIQPMGDSDNDYY